MNRSFCFSELSSLGIGFTIGLADRNNLVKKLLEVRVALNQGFGLTIYKAGGQPLNTQAERFIGALNFTQTKNSRCLLRRTSANSQVAGVRSQEGRELDPCTLWRFWSSEREACG